MSNVWSLGYREARAIALILAIVLWLIAAVFVFATPGYRSLAGPLKGGDFLFFYTLGTAARSGDRTILYDYDRMHALQTSLLPESERERYLPVYPPQVYLVYVPFSYLPFGAAAVLWTLIIVAVYGAIVRATWRRLRDALPDGWFVACAAAAFPPFWSLVLHGHNSIGPLAAFFLAWVALERGWKIPAGFALGLLFLKPQFGLALAVIVLCNREWGLLAGLALSAAVQLVIVAGLLDVSTFAAYAAFMQRVSAVEYLIEPKPFELHSIRALTRLVPGWIGTGLWLAASAVILQRAHVIWRRADSVMIRMAGLMLATVLISPHLFLYDASVLVLPLLWIGAWVQRDAAARSALAQRFWPLVSGLYAAFLLPFARLILVQVSVLLLAWMHLLLAEAVLSRSRRAGRSPAGPGGVHANANGARDV